MDICLTDIKGIGDARVAKLKAAGITTAEEVLQTLPVKYHDLTSFTPLSAAVGQIYNCARILKKNAQPYKYRRFVYADARCGNTELRFMWFNNPHALAKLEIGREYVFFGTYSGNNVRDSEGKKRLIITNPLTEIAAKVKTLKGILPVYRLPTGIGTATFRSAVADILQKADIKSVIWQQIREKYGIAELMQAYKNAHFPKDIEAARQAARDIAAEMLLRRYLSFYAQNRGLVTANKPHSYSAQHYWHSMDGGAFSVFEKSLGFTLTPSQKRAVEDVFADLCGSAPANRLIVGDVGSGKTAVALAAAHFCAASGGQCVFMMPTELLARQHYAGALPIFEKLNVSCACLTGSTDAAQREKLLGDIKSGGVSVVFATHSAVSQSVEFCNLWLAICDEQQRFGVNQRKKLMEKGHNPDMLFLTATPVPRTLSLALFGEMDVSYITDKPFTAKINTYLVPMQRAEDMFSFIAKNTAKCGQAYIICRYINAEKTDEGEMPSEYSGAGVENLYKSLKGTHFKNLKTAKLHGGMSAEKKRQQMDKFASGGADVLIATTLVEVGIDVHSANIIAVMDADKYGLSQLHQLRGRVARGGGEGHCFFVYNCNHTDDARQRLLALKQSDDGFFLAAKDLEIRGAGDFLSQKQHGAPAFPYAEYVDEKLLKTVLFMYRDMVKQGIDISVYKDTPQHDMKDIVLN